MSVRTAQNYEKQAGLPVKRMQGPRGRVVAHKEDLLKWKADQFGSVVSGIRPNGVQALREDLGRENTATEVVPNDSSEAQLTSVTVTPVLPSVIRKRLISSTIASVVVVGVVMILLLIAKRHVWHLRIPVAYRLEVSTLITLDGQGHEVWRHEFPKPLAIGHYQGAPEQRCKFADVDGDGRTDTLFAYFPEDVAVMGTELICFSQEGRIKWKFAPGRARIHDNSGDEFFPPYIVVGILVLPAQARATPRVVVSSVHNIEAPDQLAVLDPTGRLVSEYWHPGHLKHLAQADLNHNGRPLLLAGGVNNAYHSATLLIFDPTRVGGTAAVTDALSPGFGLRGFPLGTESAIVQFPRTCVGRFKPYNRVREVRVTRERLFVIVTEDVNELSPTGVIYELDYQLNVLSVVPLFELQAAHRELQKAGDLDHAFSAEDVERWKKAVVVSRK